MTRSRPAPISPSAVLELVGRDREGAASVEFVIAMVPVFMMLFSFMQISKLYTANLVFQHAATIAVRSAAVIVEPTANPGDNGDDDDVKQIARLALGAWQTAIGELKVEISSAASTQNVNGLVTVKMTGQFMCGVAMGATMVCGADKKVELKSTARFPLQGARYRLSNGAGMKTPIGSLGGPSGSTVCDPSSPLNVCQR